MADLLADFRATVVGSQAARAFGLLCHAVRLHQNAELAGFELWSAKPELDAVDGTFVLSTSS